MLPLSGLSWNLFMNDEFQENRSEVWHILSRLFLDTELQEKELEYIAELLSTTDFSIQELQYILYYEVYPACKFNLLSVAGIWEEFDQQWLIKKIMNIKNKQFIYQLPPLRKWMFNEEWTVIVKHIQQKRMR